jgi:DNA-binding response OmpR family regulator
MPPATVLIIDDDSRHLGMHSRILSHAGFRTITATAGGNRLLIPEHEVPSIILIDYRLDATLNCREVISMLRQQYPLARIALLSSMPDLPNDVRGSVDAFIRKGDPEAIIASTCQLINGNKSK